MMGRQTVDQSQLFYLFNLEEQIPADHLLRRLNPIVTRVLVDLREKLAPFYSDIGRPSIDPELMIRCSLSATAMASALNGSCARRSNFISVIVGSAASNSMTRFPIIRRSQLIVTAGFAIATSYARCSRRWSAPVWT